MSANREAAALRDVLSRCPSHIMLPPEEGSNARRSPQTSAVHLIATTTASLREALRVAESSRCDAGAWRAIEEAVWVFGAAWAAAAACESADEFERLVGGHVNGLCKAAWDIYSACSFREGASRPAGSSVLTLRNAPDLMQVMRVVERGGNALIPPWRRELVRGMIIGTVVSCAAPFELAPEERALAARILQRAAVIAPECVSMWASRFMQTLVRLGIAHDVVLTMLSHKQQLPIEPSQRHAALAAVSTLVDVARGGDAVPCVLASVEAEGLAVPMPEQVILLIMQMRTDILAGRVATESTFARQFLRRAGGLLTASPAQRGAEVGPASVAVAAQGPGAQETLDACFRRVGQRCIVCFDAHGGDGAALWALNCAPVVRGGDGRVLEPVHALCGMCRQAMFGRPAPRTCPLCLRACSAATRS